ncbi:MAG TPA: class I SAM-dependent methyltransferase [Candidatus Margulisiibacteriota bacterium]|nr:class I SAM-dependent methyltransferase [Candidatus Margulisiibacteriota bacterium]
MPFGSEVALTPGLNRFERWYIQLLGAPILGLRIRANAILALLQSVGTPQRIADAGSGRGVITLECARRFAQAEVVGLDLNEAQCRINGAVAQQLGLTNVRFACADVMRLGEFGQFDLILSSDNLEHLEDDLGCARVFWQALHPGGYLLVHVPHLTRNLFGWHRTNWMDIEGHVRPGYSRDGLLALLGRAGFETVDCRYNYNSLETLANDLSYLITGGRERHRQLYALAFPLLLGLAAVGSLYRPRRDGSGLVALARRPGSKPPLISNPQSAIRNPQSL